MLLTVTRLLTWKIYHPHRQRVSSNEQQQCGFSEKHHISQSSKQEIIQGVQGFSQIVLGEGHTAVNSALSEAAIDIPSLSSVADIFQPDMVFGSTFSCLQTQHLQLF